MYGAQFIVLRSIIFIGLFIGNNNSSGISANNYWLITTLLITFFRAYNLSYVQYNFPHHRFRPFSQHQLQPFLNENPAEFRLLPFWVPMRYIYICSDKIERPMTNCFLDKLLWRTTIIQSCSRRTPERVISVAPIELRLFHNFLCHVSQSFSPCSPFVVPYFPIWLWQSAQIKYVVADLIWHVRHGTFLYSSTRHRSILVNNFPFVKYIYKIIIFMQ